jgi:2-methylcitrate dehydratase PrpD
VSVARTQARLAVLAEFVTTAQPPASARARAAAALLDTVGVTLAGAVEPVARIVQSTIGGNGGGVHAENGGRVFRPGDAEGCAVIGTAHRAAAPDAALANGTAAHALDYDDMCFVSLAHPSAPLVPAVLAAGELNGSSGAAILDAYVVGFEIEARLGRLMNPRHYQRGWHCTSTLGVLGAAAASSRLAGLDAVTIAHALGIAASAASGLKDNFGSMVKPLHAGLAARDGVLASLLARGGLTASAQALDGPQGFLHAMDSERQDLARELEDLGMRWEVLDTGITMKLYPSCAATHPPLDALLELRAEEGLTPTAIDAIDVDVDRITPTVLLYDRPATPLEAKFSLNFCAAVAIADGRVGIDTFTEDRLRDESLRALMARVTMGVDEALGRNAPPLTEARVHVRLRGGRTLVREVRGARGTPERPASSAEVDAKFLACARRALPEEKATRALERLRRVEELTSIRELTHLLT